MYAAGIVMKILIAPNNYKESISAEAAARSLEKGLLSINPSLETTCLPLSDGGEGFTKALVNATDGEIIPCQAYDPLGRVIDTYYGSIPGKIAVIEMALASGIELLVESERNPWLTSTFGTGQLIKDALSKGFCRIVIGLGGSATNDVGMGMIQALGGAFYHDNGSELGYGGRYLGEVQRVELGAFRRHIRSADFTVACDVTNPLLGERGATYVYGPQKGADLEMLDHLEAGARHFSEKVNEALQVNHTNSPGAGAAGGMGYALLTFMGAKFKPGYDIVAEYTGLARKAKEADLIVTGEGKIDDQTLQGKVISRLGAMAREYGKRMVAVGGVIESIDLASAGIDRSYAIIDQAKHKEDAMKNASDYLQNIGQEIARSL